MKIFEGVIDSGYQDVSDHGGEPEMVVQVDRRAVSNGEAYTDTRQMIIPSNIKWSNSFRNKKLVISIEDR